MRSYLSRPEKLWLLLPALLWAGLAAAQEQSEVKLSGFAEFDHISYFRNQEGQINGRNQGILQLEISNRQAAGFGYFGALEFRNDVSDPQRNRLWVDELYLSWKTKHADWRLGKMVYAWGAADGFNPTNHLNPVDYSDLLDIEGETIGVYSLHSKWYRGRHYLEGVLVPIFQPSVLPGAGSRWQLGYPSAMALSDRLLPVGYTFAQERRPEADLRSMQFGLRLGGTRGRLDYNLSYYRGYDDLPYLHRQLAVFSDSVHMGLQPQYHRIQAYGADFSTILAGMTLKGELSYIYQKAPKDQPWFMGAPYWYGVFGLDKMFAEVGDGINLLLNAQWLYQYIDSPYEVNSFNYNHIFQNAGMLQAEIGKLSVWKASVTGIYDVKFDHFWLRPSLEFMFDSQASLKLSAYVLGGAEGSLFGSYHNNRLQLLAKRSF